MPAGAGENLNLGGLIFPENPVSRQAESGRFQQRRSLARWLRTFAVSRHDGVRHPSPAGL